MRVLGIVVVVCTLLFSAAIVIADDTPGDLPKDAADSAAVDSIQQQAPDRVVVYYLHMNRRCMTCGKLEAYAREAVEVGFAQQLEDSSIVFRVENFEQKGNEHFAEHYQLYSQSLILSRQHEGKETEWKNLDRIWQLVGNREDFIAYVQTEVFEFMHPENQE